MPDRLGLCVVVTGVAEVKFRPGHVDLCDHVRTIDLCDLVPVFPVDLCDHGWHVGLVSSEDVAIFRWKKGRWLKET